MIILVIITWTIHDDGAVIVGMCHVATTFTLELSVITPILVYDFIIVPCLEAAIALRVFTVTRMTLLGCVVRFHLSDICIVLEGFLGTPVAHLSSLTLF